MKHKDLIYKILKIIESGKEPFPTDVEANVSDFKEAVVEIHEHNLVSNVSVNRVGDKIISVHLNNTKLTDRGKWFIEQFEKQ